MRRIIGMLACTAAAWGCARDEARTPSASTEPTPTVTTTPVLTSEGSSPGDTRVMPGGSAGVETPQPFGLWSGSPGTDAQVTPGGSTAPAPVQDDRYGAMPGMDRSDYDPMDRTDQMDRMDRADQMDRTGQMDRADQMDRMDRADQMDRMDDADRTVTTPGGPAAPAAPMHTPADTPQQPGTWQEMKQNLKEAGRQVKEATGDVKDKAVQETRETSGDVKKAGAKVKQEAKETSGDVKKAGAKVQQEARETSGDAHKAGRKVKQEAKETGGDIGKAGRKVKQEAKETGGDVKKAGKKVQDKVDQSAQPGGPAEVLPPGTGTPGDAWTTQTDRALVQRIRQALREDPRLDDFADHISIVANQGQVSIHGHVPSEADRLACENLVAPLVGGRQHLTNRLSVGTGEVK